MLEKTVDAPAKINLVLRIVGRRADGYHFLESLMVPISLCDKLRIRLEHAPSPRISVSSDSDAVPVGPSNHAYRAAQLLLVAAQRNCAVGIHISKRIPMGSGLGGGSSDAATVLLTLNRLLGEPVDLHTLTQLAAQIGSDVPFFLLGQPAQVGGIGEQVTPVRLPAPLHMVVCFDGVPLSTALVYSGVSLDSLTTGSGLSNIATFVNGQKPISELLMNDLEAAASQIHPAVLSLKAKLMDHGAVGALMTGSGSAVFGVWRDAHSAQAAALRLRAHGLWAHAVSTLDAPPAASDDGRSPSGKAPDFGSGIEGSNPSRPVLAGAKKS